MFKTLAIVDDVHTCDCCGKSSLKSTVAMENEAGEIVHFGSVCATKHSGRSQAKIKAEAFDVYVAKVLDARTAYRATPERAAAMARIKAAHDANIGPGTAFRDFGIEATRAADEVARVLAAKFGVKFFEVTA